MNEINFNVEDIEQVDLSIGMGIKEIYPPIEDLEVTPTKEQQVFNHENSYGYDEVIVEPIPDEYIIPDGTLEVGANGDVDVTMYRMARVGVYTPPTLQDKEITINENGTHDITYDEGYDGLNQVSVTVDAIENLEEELETYNTEITEQETTVNDIVETLKTKAIPSGGGSRSIITVGLSSDMNFNAYNNSIVPLNVILNKKGDELSLDTTNNAVKIGAGVSKILVSGTMTQITTITGLYGGNINKNVLGLNAAVNVGFNYVPVTNVFYKTTFSPVLVDVVEGDLIFLTTYSETSQTVTIRAYEGRSTNITVEVVE